VNADPIGITKVVIITLFEQALVTADPILLDRPPKSPLSI
jgi:hypothetical protein